MKDCDNLSEISVDCGNKTIVEYWSNSIPRVGENIEFDNKIFKVTGVTHNVTERRDSYVPVEVLPKEGK
jgi:hypothetical protein